MQIGFLTTPFIDESWDNVVDFAMQAAIPCLEVHAGGHKPHLDPTKMTAALANRVRQELEQQGLAISALATYDATLTDPARTKEVQAQIKHCITAAARLKVDTVCLNTGFPASGLSAIDTIRTVLPQLFRPLLAHARKHGVRLALENWHGTCLRGIDTFECLFETIPDAELGLNYDPSHLVHQSCDYLAPIRMFPDRIFHVHAKDTFIDHGLRAHVGVLGGDWWRYVLPGCGEINWGAVASQLRIHGYDGVLSIEHEDPNEPREDGFMRAAWYLEQFC